MYAKKSRLSKRRPSKYDDDAIGEDRGDLLKIFQMNPCIFSNAQNHLFDRANLGVRYSSIGHVSCDDQVAAP